MCHRGEVFFTVWLATSSISIRLLHRDWWGWNLYAELQASCGTDCWPSSATTSFHCIIYIGGITWQEGQRKGAMNAELFARGKDNVSLLLSLLEEERGPSASDFYVRYHALQLLTCCAMAGSYRLQEVLLLFPQLITPVGWYRRILTASWGSQRV